MKPSKNRVHCNACGRTKMLFNSKEEAELFMKFNASKIESENGYAPIRAYYCMHCGGWHVTSQEGFATVLIKEVNRHLARLKKYILKEDKCKANMEYMKAYRFLSRAANVKGENERKLVLVEELMVCRQWFDNQAA